jgi:hypothetical protein
MGCTSDLLVVRGKLASSGNLAHVILISNLHQNYTSIFVTTFILLEHVTLIANFVKIKTVPMISLYYYFDTTMVLP